MEAGVPFEEEGFFRALRNSGARVLLIGRRAMVVLGIPVATYDYDLWVHFDDVELLNAAMAPLEHMPNHEPADARARGRYVPALADLITTKRWALRRKDIGDIQLLEVLRRTEEP